jgi:DNA-binding transcriptional regulator LsrR (DeoR family)
MSDYAAHPGNAAGVRKSRTNGPGGSAPVERPMLGPAEMVRTATIARRYYLEGRSKIDLAQEFGLSRFKIARILDEAVAQGIVQISITLPAEIDSESSEILRQRYGLRRAIVVLTADEPQSSLRSHVGRVAADLLGEIVEEGDILGMSWGRTLTAMAEHLTTLPRCTTVQLTGVSFAAAREAGSVELVRRVARASGGPAYPIYAPLLVPDGATAAALRQQPEVAEAVRRYEDLSVAVVTVGTWAPGSSLAYAVWPEPERSELHKRGVVAEVCARLIDAEGRPIETEASKGVIGITVEQLGRVPEVVLVSAGLDKVPAVAAALRSGFVTSLVTDANVARTLLRT